MGKLNRLDEALAAYDRAIGLDPSLALAHSNRGSILWSLHRLDEALVEYDRAIQLDPSDALALNTLAWFLAICPDQRLRDPERAVEVAKRAIARASEEGSLWNTLGVALYRTGEFEESRKALVKSMELRSGGDPWDWFFLAMATDRLGHRDEARRRYERGALWLREREPKDPDLERLRAEAAEVLGLEGSTKAGGNR